MREIKSSDLVVVDVIAKNGSWDGINLRGGYTVVATI
jgi:hypothetical protein